MSQTERLSDRLLNIGGGLIIGFPSVEADVPDMGLNQMGGVRAYFFRVAREAELFFEPYGQIGAMNDGDTLGFDYLGDTGIGSGNDIFRIQRDDWHVYHFGVGVKSPDLRVYYSHDPHSNGERAFEYKTGTQDVSVGDDRSHFDGRLTGDRFDPPSRTERIAIRNDKNGEFLQWGFEAQDGLTAAETELVIAGRAYKLYPVTDSDEQEDMLRGAQSNQQEIHTDYPVTYHQFGGMQTWSLGTEAPGEWSEDHRLDLTLDIAET
jgi:hypothetical protein